MTDEEKTQQLVFAKQYESCPVCCTELKYEGYHEFDMGDRMTCPKCKWSVLASDLGDIDIAEEKCEMIIYLCGPINGCTDEECKDWRNATKKRFHNTLDPMRRDYRGRETECMAEIVELDKKDIDESDALLVNHPKPSVGTAMEIFYAWQKEKMVIVVCPKGVPRSSWLIYHSYRIFETFEEAYQYLEERNKNFGGL